MMSEHDGPVGVDEVTIYARDTAEAVGMTGMNASTLRYQLTHGLREGTQDEKGKWTQIAVQPEELSENREPETPAVDAELLELRARLAAMEAENALLRDEVAYLRESSAREQQIRMADIQQRAALPAPEPVKRVPWWKFTRG